MTEQRRVVAGIDGGGTKTTVLLVGLDGTVMAEASGGGSNVRTSGVAASAAVIFELLRRAADQARASHDAVVQVVAGVAGAGRPAVRTELAAAISTLAQRSRFPLTQVTVETDARIALEAAFPGRAVIALIAGTGSIALYRAEDGRIHRAGGWGSAIGDEGSGYAIGRDACAAAMRQHDGRGERTALTAKAMEHFRLSEIEDLAGASHADPAAIAAFAAQVIDAAAGRDRAARQILLRNAAELVEHVRVLTQAHPPRQRLPVCPMGGLLEHDHEYSRMVREKLAATLPQIVIQKPKFPPAFGAAIMGLNAFR